MGVAKVKTAETFGVLTPIWTTKTETANRVCQRIEAVLDHASALGIWSGDKPAQWRGHLGHPLTKPSKVRAVRHDPALPHAEITDFMPDLIAGAGIHNPNGGTLWRNTRRDMARMSMTAVLRRTDRIDNTVHGFRSTFRDWLGETTGVPREVIGAALADGIKDKAEAAFARSDLFEKRRDLMATWAEFVIAKDFGGNAVAMNQRQDLSK